MARSSNIAAAWTLTSERGGAVAGPLFVHKSQPLQLRGTLAGREKYGARKVSTQSRGRGESLHLWLESREPQGAWSIQYTAAVDTVRTRLRGGVEEEWGSWQSAPRGQMFSRSYWPVPADGERPLPSDTELVSVNCAGLFASYWHLMQPFAYTGPTRGSVVTNQHDWTLCRLSEL